MKLSRVIILLFHAIVNSSSNSYSIKSSEVDVFKGPCPKNGTIADPDDPRKYYQCKITKEDNTYELQAVSCKDDTVWSQEYRQCRAGNFSTDYPCLKEKLDSDATRICFDETIDMLTKGVESFIDAAATRGDSKRNFHLSVRDIHLNMRENYGKMIQSVGQNIYPLIVATDSDTPELAGTGGAYKVYFRNGTMKRIVPVGSDFELHKCLSHMILGIFSIISPYFRASHSLNWQPKLKDFNQRVTEALFALPGSGLSSKEKKHAEKMLNMVDSYIKKAIEKNSVSYKTFHKFANEIAPYIDKSMEVAAKAHVTATIPALQKLKVEMGDTEWKKVYVIIPTVWPVSLYNIRLQMFRKVMDFKQIKQQVLIVEGARSEDDARTTLGRIVADRALAQLVFGGLEKDSMRDHLFSLSTRRDLLSSTEEEAIGRWCKGDDDWSILTDKSKKSRCPMSKHFATMLRQAP